MAEGVGCRVKGVGCGTQGIGLKVWDLRSGLRGSRSKSRRGGEREFFIDNLMVQIHFIIVMIRWTGLAPWGFEFPSPCSLTSTFLGGLDLGGTRSVGGEGVHAVERQPGGWGACG
jgi:hypothetical protein